MTWGYSVDILIVDNITPEGYSIDTLILKAHLILRKSFLRLSGNQFSLKKARQVYFSIFIF